MVSRVTYRPFEEDDFEDLAEILHREWYGHLSAPEVGLLAAKNDLAYMLSISTFSQVVFVDDSARGIVLARPDGKRTVTSSRWRKISENYLRQMRELSPLDAAEYWETIELENAKNSKLLEKSGFAKSGEISLLAVCSSTRGMGLGSVLIDAATSYLASIGAHKAFLYTDTDCTWNFYEHHGFKRACTYRSTREERRLLAKEMYVYGLDLSA